MPLIARIIRFLTFWTLCSIVQFAVACVLVALGLLVLRGASSAWGIPGFVESDLLVGAVFLSSPVLGALWAWLLVRWADRPLHPVGHCRVCGYNLTGNVSGICPECGLRVPWKLKASNAELANSGRRLMEDV